MHMSTSLERTQAEQLSRLAEWADASRIWKSHNLGRTTLTRLARERKIRSCSLQEPGMARGKRLYHIGDLRAYLEKRAEASFI